MKAIFKILVLGSVACLIFSCGKSEIKTKNPAPPAAQNSGPAQPNTNTPPPASVATEEMILEAEALQLSKSGAPFVLNKMASQAAKAKSRLTKKFTFKSDKKLSLNIKSGLQNVGRSQCEIDGKPEVTAIIKNAGKESSSKFSDLTTLELNANQEFAITVSIDNSQKCAMLLFEFAILASEVSVSEEQPPVVIVPVVGQLVVETKEFLSAGSFGACFDWACFTRDLKTSTKKYANPSNQMEEITEDHFTLSTSLDLVCLNRRNVADTTGITNSVCKLILNPGLTTNDIKIYRGQDNKLNLVGADITDPALLEKLCNKFPTITSDDKVAVFIDETNKKEIPRLELSCTYENNKKPKSATFFGVLN